MPTMAVTTQAVNATAAPYVESLTADDATWVLISAFIIFTMQSGKSSAAVLHNLYYAVRSSTEIGWQLLYFYNDIQKLKYLFSLKILNTCPLGGSTIV